MSQPPGGPLFPSSIFSVQSSELLVLLYSNGACAVSQQRDQYPSSSESWFEFETRSSQYGSSLNSVRMKRVDRMFKERKKGDREVSSTPMNWSGAGDIGREIERAGFLTERMGFEEMVASRPVEEKMEWIDRIWLSVNPQPSWGRGYYHPSGGDTPDPLAERPAIDRTTGRVLE